MISFYHLIWNLTNRNFYFWLIKCFAINFDILFTPKHLGSKKWWKRRIRVYSSTQNVQNLLIITGKLFNFINDVFKLEDNPKSFSTFIRNKEIIFNSWYLLSNNLLTQHIFKLLILSDISTSFRVPFSYLMHKVYGFNLGLLHLQINFYLYLFNSLITVIGILFTNARRIIFKTAKALKAMALSHEKQKNYSVFLWSFNYVDVLNDTTLWHFNNSLSNSSWLFISSLSSLFVTFLTVF